MKAHFLQAAVFVIELPLAILILPGFLLLVLLHFINDPMDEEPEESGVRLHPKPNDKFWPY